MLLVGILGWSGCAARAPEPPPPPPRTMEIAAGERFTIELDASAASGLRWYLASPAPDPAVVRVLSAEYRPPTQPLADTTGLEVWTFEALAPGSTVVAFAYRRPWATAGTPPLRQARFAIRVRAPR